MSNKLTDKQEKFVQECAKGKTQSDAYKIAYNASKMKDSTVWRKASEELAKPHVKARFNELHDKIRDKAEQKAIFTVEGVLNDMKELIERNMEKDDRVAIDGLKTVMKHLGMLTEKIELEVTKMPTIKISK